MDVPWFILSFSLCKEAARTIKLLEEWQKNRAQRSNKKQATALPHELETGKNCTDSSSFLLAAAQKALFTVR